MKTNTGHSWFINLTWKRENAWCAVIMWKKM